MKTILLLITSLLIVCCKNGEREGLATKWHENGMKKEEETYKDGKWEGMVTIWDENGKVLQQTRYKDGFEVEE